MSTAVVLFCDEYPLRYVLAGWVPTVLARDLPVAAYINVDYQETLWGISEHLFRGKKIYTWQTSGVDTFRVPPKTLNYRQADQLFATINKYRDKLKVSENKKTPLNERLRALRAALAARDAISRIADGRSRLKPSVIPFYYPNLGGYSGA